MIVFLLLFTVIANHDDPLPLQINQFPRFHFRQPPQRRALRNPGWRIFLAYGDLRISVPDRRSMDRRRRFSPNLLLPLKMPSTESAGPGHQTEANGWKN